MAIKGLPKTIPELIAQARSAHMAGQVAEAATLYERVLENDPGNVNALHLYGVLATQAGQPQQAMALIERAIGIDASRAIMHFNLGNACLQAGLPERALAAYREACAIDNALAAGFCGASRALLALGDNAAAAQAAETAIAIDTGSVDALQCLAIARQNSGQLDGALDSYRKALALAPDNPELLNNAGFAHYEAGQYEEAARLCRQASIALPEYGAAFTNLGLALTETGRFEAACTALRRAVQLLPQQALCHNALGRALMLGNAYQPALEAFTRATQLQPRLESAHNNRGLALQRLSQLEPATQAWQEALAINPTYVDAWLNLANLQEQQNQLEAAANTVASAVKVLPAEPALILMSARLKRRAGDSDGAASLLAQLSSESVPLSVAQRLLFEQGKVANERAEEPQAFAAFAQANTLSLNSPAGKYYQSKSYLAKVSGLASAMQQDWTSDWQSLAVAGDEPDPVFLLGFPRSGTTLLEQILTGHPQLVSLEEQSVVAQLGTRIEQREAPFPALLGQLSQPEREALRQDYFVLAAEHANWSPGQIILDKFPLNTVHLPLIHCLFPKARILLALRHPCDVVLSCFMQDFELNEAMVNFSSLQASAELYAAVMSICHSSRAGLDLTLTEVRYEDVVDDLESEARRVLDFLQLDWDETVLDFTATAAAAGRIQTPSYAQVSKALYREARHRWRRYQTQLAGVTGILAPDCEAYGYELD